MDNNIFFIENTLKAFFTCCPSFGNFPKCLFSFSLKFARGRAFPFSWASKGGGGGGGGGGGREWPSSVCAASFSSSLSLGFCAKRDSRKRRNIQRDPTPLFWAAPV